MTSLEVFGLVAPRLHHGRRLALRAVDHSALNIHTTIRPLQAHIAGTQ